MNYIEGHTKISEPAMHDFLLQHSFVVRHRSFSDDLLLVINTRTGFRNKLTRLS
jgi:hypothetical protein